MTQPCLRRFLYLTGGGRDWLGRRVKHTLRHGFLAGEMSPLLAAISPFSLILSLSGIAIVVAVVPYRHLRPLNGWELQEYFSTCKYDFTHKPPTRDSFTFDAEEEAKLDTDHWITNIPPLRCSLKDRALCPRYASLISLDELKF